MIFVNNSKVFLFKIQDFLQQQTELCQCMFRLGCSEQCLVTKFNGTGIVLPCFKYQLFLPMFLYLLKVLALSGNSCRFKTPDGLEVEIFKVSVTQ